jgi:hypothetical protein
VLTGDGTRFLGLRSCGPIAVSTSIISRFGLRLGGSSTGRAVAGTVVGSIIPSITLTGPPACASSEVLRYSIMASSCSSVRSLSELVCWTLCSRGTSSARIFKYAAERIGVLDLVLARDQQRQNLQVRGRLCSAHTFNRLRTAVPEVSEQGRNKLAVQLLAVTRADRTAGRVSRPPRFKWHICSSSCDSKLIVTLSISPLIIHENTR